MRVGEVADVASVLAVPLLSDETSVAAATEACAATKQASVIYTC